MHRAASWLAYWFSDMSDLNKDIDVFFIHACFVRLILIVYDVSLSSDCSIKLWRSSENRQQADTNKDCESETTPSCQLTIKVLSCSSYTDIYRL